MSALCFARSETLGQLAKAKAQAQSKFLPVGKDKSANIQTTKGGAYKYAYADLATCLEAVVPALSDVGIALFQPVHIEEGAATVATLLVHESGEWISADYRVGIVDPADARSVGSATTYARRYGLLAMLGYASSDEDDDGEQARGGDHEMGRPAGPPCPACGVVGSLIKGQEKYGGGWLCWSKKGGCGTKWPEGPMPTTAPPRTPMGMAEREVAEEELSAYEQEQGREVPGLDEKLERSLLLTRCKGAADKLKLSAAKRADILVLFDIRDPREASIDQLAAMLEHLRGLTA